MSAFAAPARNGAPASVAAATAISTTIRIDPIRRDDISRGIHALLIFECYSVRTDMGCVTRLSVLAAFSAAAAFAQFDTASVLGAVRDASGAVVSNAKITLRNVNTAVTAATHTNSAGEYEFLTVRIGDYKVTAEAPGFASVT